MDLGSKYEKLIKKHNSRSLIGKTKSYFFDAKKVKEKIKELREDVKDVKLSFLVRCLLSDAFTLANAKIGSLPDRPAT